MRSTRLRKWGRRFGLLLGVGVAALLVLYILAIPAIGEAPAGDRLARMTQSPQWKDGGFDNRLPRLEGPYGEMTYEWLFGGSNHRWPAEPIPVEPATRATFARPPESGLRVTWLGHSTMLLEIDGRRVLIDPVWGPRAAPWTFLGPQRFFEPPLPLAELPEIDAVLISHDHYDHLDYPTVIRLADLDLTWLVPLGIGAHLEGWGVAPAKIVELDWWEDAVVEKLHITCTPARHFSGRGLADAQRTLWSGWAIASANHRVFYSGDTAMHEAFIEIGERLGPFDLTMMEVGAYNAMWADVHLGPEQAVRAHRLVRGSVLLPVHWGMFDLALHGWTEPIERVLAAAERECVRVVMPPPGRPVEPTRTSSTAPLARWWPEVPWETFEQAPCPSSEVDALNGSRYAPSEPCLMRTASLESDLRR